MNSTKNNLYEEYHEKKHVVLVTGCSSGIGLELAHQLISRNDLRVIITTRTESLSLLREKFKESERFLIRTLDVTNDEQIYQVINEVCCLWGGVDIVINNAAICFRSVIEHMDSASENLQMATNFLGPMSLIRSVFPIMREQHFGHIINISSVSGTLSIPTMGSYSASKHALEAASEALWYEGRPFGIKVNIIELGFINSDSFKKVIVPSKAKLSMAVRGPLAEYYRSIVPFVERLMGLSKTSSEKVARHILRLIDKPSTSLRLTYTWDAWFLGLVRKILPSTVFIHLIYFLLPGSKEWGVTWTRSQKVPGRILYGAAVQNPARHLSSKS